MDRRSAHREEENMIATADDYECNTCGDTGRWETTFEETPTVLVDIGACPDCDLGKEQEDN